ncbi:sdpn-1 [Pristionchus pacificus]|uniref:Sdpn-1 n=1 Tax=Pristionchus pacificus TaxID=54126 RepID=A0A454Y2I0_PRIPA|nr:sdpn-1 [Pristionchus pacificus]|eukprot:PDM84095.1 sdpn-1 [Pristionchus pacificus]
MAETAMGGFWEIGAYRTNVKRIRDGMEQIEELSRMAKERAEIEKQYVRSLQTFSDKWRGQVDRTVPEGALKRGWLTLVEESEALSMQHGRARDRLLDEIVKTLALFRKENHHPSAFRSPKEIREIEEAFEKAQKHWKKLFERVESAKKAYHGACRAEKSAGILVQNAQADTAVTPDQVNKMKERLMKAKDDVVKTRKHYELQLQEIAQYRGPYIENMSFVFEKCQLGEMKRAKFLIEMMAGHESVMADLVRNRTFINLHIDMEQKFKETNESVLQADLKQWSTQFGVDAATLWPTYEEYSPEMRQISNSKTMSKDNGGVVLTRQIIKNEEVPAAVSTRTSTIASSKRNSVIPEPPKPSNYSDSDTGTYDSRKSAEKPPKIEDAKGSQEKWADSQTDSQPATTPDSAKFADFDDDTPVAPVRGRDARVLYDYNPMEDDEIALKKGEIIELLSEPDSLGWCQGRVGTACGLFPASYVQTV